MHNDFQQIFEPLQQRFGSQFKSQVDLSYYSTARVGGKARWFIIAKNKNELAEIVKFCWKNEVVFYLLGAGSNVLFSDQGFNGLVIQNQAKKITIKTSSDKPIITAESGTNLGLLARKASIAGLSGLEWATTVPGTVGGAVFGNAGAHGGDISDNLLLAEILQQNHETSVWKKDNFHFGYRESVLKNREKNGIILSATFECKYDDPELIKERMNKFSEYRRRTQPPGASMGSMFKNPTGDYAGRLIEAAGLKGFRIGGVSISEVHANFFVNTEQARANDFFELITFVKQTVKEKFNVDLELEVELVGFNQIANNKNHHPGEAVR
jgi:UDP-N-acetylmuramate dehydrogenase